MCIIQTMKLKDKVVVITGSSSGIGKEVALSFAKRKAKIIFSYRKNKKGAEDVLDEIKKNGSEAAAFSADLNNDKDAQSLVDFAIQQHGHIDILVNNAGGYISGDEWNGKYEIWDETLKQNLLSILSVSKYAFPFMKEKKSGVIVNVSSRYSVEGQFDAIAYAASKSAIVNVTEAYAKLMAPWGRANAVSPGTVRAGYWLQAKEEELKENLSRTLLSSFVEPSDIANAVLFLASDNSRMITGQNLIVDAGFTLK